MRIYNFENKKKCKKCKIEKSYDEFYKALRLKDGYESSCKQCRKEYNKLYHKNTVFERKIKREKLDKENKMYCCETSCNRKTYGTSLFCKKHYEKNWRDGKIIKKPKCSIVGCDRSSYGRKDLCNSHYQRLLKGNNDAGPIRSIAKRGSGYINKNGYRVITRNTRQILEHRAIMAEYLGRELLECETVHHINGNRLDNKISNLELWTTVHPYGQRVSDKLAWAKEIIDFYGPILEPRLHSNVLEFDPSEYEDEISPSSEDGENSDESSLIPAGVGATTEKP